MFNKSNWIVRKSIDKTYNCFLHQAHAKGRTSPRDKSAVVRPVPPPQSLPRAVLDPAKPRVALGLDVHLDFIMAVAQQDHASPHAPRKFTRQELVAQAGKWVAAGFQVFCVQESCGFGFVLHRQLVAAGAQSFLITPVALNGKRKTDKLDARALCLRLARWVDSQARRNNAHVEGTRRRKFLGRQIRALANHGHGQVAEYCHRKLPVALVGSTQLEEACRAGRMGAGRAGAICGN